MKIKNISVIYFSPTGQTGHVTRTIAKKLSEALHLSMYSYDISLEPQRENMYQFESDELVIVGFPVYAGRLPNKILPYIKRAIKGQGTYVLPVVTYGNRNYDGALLELHDELSTNGFVPIGASAIVCKHVFSHKIASDRPNDEDWQLVDQMVEKVIEKMTKQTLNKRFSIDGQEKRDIYYQPLGIDGQPVRFLKAKPNTDSDKCLKCGRCVSICPMSAIEELSPQVVSGTCIKCQACVSICPVSAKVFTDEAFLSHVKMLEANYQAPKDSYIFV